MFWAVLWVLARVNIFKRPQCAQCESLSLLEAVLLLLTRHKATFFKVVCNYHRHEKQLGRAIKMSKIEQISLGVAQAYTVNRIRFPLYTMHWTIYEKKHWNLVFVKQVIENELAKADDFQNQFVNVLVNSFLATHSDSIYLLNWRLPTFSPATGKRISLPSFYGIYLGSSLNIFSLPQSS